MIRIYYCYKLVLIHGILFCFELLFVCFFASSAIFKTVYLATDCNVLKA